MSKHTPEPFDIKGAWDSTPKPFMSQDLLRRASVCVAACAGMEDPEKEIALLKRDAIYVDDPEGVAMMEDKIASLRADKQVLLDALESLRRKHDVCEDTFYSCPKADPEDYIDCGRNLTECNCGADYYNQIIEKALAKVRGKESTHD